MKKNVKMAKELVRMAKELVGYKENNQNEQIVEIDVENVKIIIEPWDLKEAAVINVVEGGTPHFKSGQIKNLLDRIVPSFELKATNPEQQAELEKNVVDCFGSREGLIEQLKNIDQTGTFYAQVDNFKPFCDAYHVKNANGVEMYVKLYVEYNKRKKSDVVFVVRCHKDN